MPGKEVRRRNLTEALNALKEAGLVGYERKNNGFALIFREGIMAVDYYPSTKKWRSEGKTFFGDAKAFVKWYTSRMDKYGAAKSGQSVDLMGQALESLYAAVRTVHDAVETVAQLIAEERK